MPAAADGPSPPLRAAGAAGATPASEIRFGRFELQPRERRLLVDGQPAVLGARALDLLFALAERAGQLVTRNELIDRVWPGLVVEENNLSVQVNALRKVLGGDLIATVPGRGYRFTARIVDQSQAQPAMAAVAAGEAYRHKTNLPAALTPLLGREDDLDALEELIARHRLVSLVGAGGMGKSLLAQHLLRRHETKTRHGVCWVELAPVTDAEAVPAAVAAALGVQPSAGDALPGLVKAVGPLEMLVALDNAEHLLDGVARVADALHGAVPGLRLLVTSQVPLRLAAERVVRLGALAVPTRPLPAAQALAFGAVALFVERAQAADARFALTDTNVPAVIDVCRALDGMALAIELAAARTPMLGVQRLASSMNERLKMLTAGRNRAAPARQQTLRATLEWSHGLLEAREQTVFRRLGVFSGSASLELIQQVVADAPGQGELDGWTVLDALGRLVDRSLVAVLAAGDAGEPRYRLLDSPRAFALERLAAADEDPALRRRHAQSVLDLLDTSVQALLDGRIGINEWRRRAEPDLDNGREAFAWAHAAGDPVLALGLGSALLWVLPESLHAERLRLCDACEALITPELPAPLRRRAWSALSRSWFEARHKRSDTAARQALALARSVDAFEPDRWELYRALCNFASAAARQGDPQARSACAEAQAIEDPGWPPVRLGFLCEAQAWEALRTGDSREALRVCRRAHALKRQAGGDGLWSLAQLVDIELQIGDRQAAVLGGTELVDLLQGTRDEVFLPHARLKLAVAWLALNDAAQARAQLEAGWPLALRFDLTAPFADAMALLAALEGRPRAAARLAGYADGRYVAFGRTRQPNDAAAVARACARAASVLGEAEVRRQQDEGAALGDADVAALAFAHGDG